MSGKKYEGFIYYLKSVLQDSMLTGIPNIVTAPSIPKKILKTLVFLSSLVGFLYQTTEFMNMYWEYDTIVDIQVENPKRSEMPSITVCTNNGIMTSKICAKNSSLCDMVTKLYGNELCHCRPNFCIGGVLQNLTTPHQSVLEDLAYSEYKDYKPYLVPLDKLIKNCYTEQKEIDHVLGNCQIHYQNIRCPHQFDSLFACYTLHTLLDWPDREEDKVSTKTMLILEFDTLLSEYNLKVKETNHQISIHHSRNILNPYLYGHRLKKGHLNTFYLSKIIKHLLPPPYKTNCKDYLTDWKSRGGFGPTNEKECVEECERNSSMEILGCIDFAVHGPTNERRCRGSETDERVFKAAYECELKNCKPACYELRYEALRHDMEFFAFGKRLCFPPVKIRSMTRAAIRLDGLQTTIYTYSPKFEYIETFSYIGGYVGMWLGISLIAVFDFLETLLDILGYPLRKIMQHRARQQRVDYIGKFHRNI